MVLMAIVEFNDGERRTPQHVCVYVFMDFCFFGIYVGMSISLCLCIYATRMKRKKITGYYGCFLYSINRVTILL